jgi:hypothetical protein
MTLSIIDTQQNNAVCSCAEYRFLYIAMLGVIIVNVMMLSVVVPIQQPWIMKPVQTSFLLLFALFC